MRTIYSMGTKNPLDVNNISIGTSGIPTEAGVSVRSSTVTNDSDSYMSLISNTKPASKIARYNTGRGANQPDYDNLYESTIGSIDNEDNDSFYEMYDVDYFNVDSKITSALDIDLDELVRKDAVIRIKEEEYINVGESRGWARMTSSMGQKNLSTLCCLYAPVSFGIVAAPYVEYMSTSIKIPVVSVGNTFTQGNVRYAFRYHSGSHSVGTMRITFWI